MSPSSLQRILLKATDGKKIFGTSFCLKYKEEIFSGSSGNLSQDTPFFIASTTKLFVTAVIMQLRSRGKLDPEDHISKYLDTETMKGLHVLKGTDRSGEIRIRHLLAHTAGIPDYFQQKDEHGNSLEKELMKGNDRAWSFAEAVEWSKRHKPYFAPDTPGKAHYSDTHFQLLGKIIENICGRELAEVFSEFIITPLSLNATRLYRDEHDKSPAALWYRDRPLHIPKAMVSFGADGGVVSNAADLLRFTEAFFGGKLFPAAYLNEMQQWNRIFFPMRSGIGIHLFRLPRIMDPFRTVPDLIGHSGLSGALAFCNPEKKLFIAGTVNQVAFPSLSFRLAVRLIQDIR